PIGDVHFAEAFDGMCVSLLGKWALREAADEKLVGDKGLVLESRAKHHAIAAFLNKPFHFLDKPLILQYEVNFQNGIECGGAYTNFYDKTPYTIMFGPDKCGEDYKLHFIFRHKNPKTGELEEKHAKRPDADLKAYYTDKKPHLYTLIVRPDNSFEILVDGTSVNTGSLLEDMTPPINPPKEIEDPEDHKPEDWDERPKIPDDDAVKPDDWDEDAPAQIPDDTVVKPEGWLDEEPEYAPDPEAAKPDDWDEDMDGEWEAPQVPNPVCKNAPGCGTWNPPMISNPAYKGKWKQPLIDNPHYQGVWKPRKIQNPAYFEDQHPFRMTSFSALGLELWSMSSEILFDNFIICSDRSVADQWAADGWGLKQAAAAAEEPGIVGKLYQAADERPWLWAVYVFTVALPIVLLISFCWPNKSDAVQPDDQKEGDKDEENDGEEDKDESNGARADEVDAKKCKHYKRM
uniref:Si:ch211-274f20.2 n=1 Tax=Eptatretus burgeri TaxID=7764 RepID=A0A8C4WXU3_EPTBU